MLSKTRSVKKIATRLALFVPVLALCVYFFNQEIVAKPATVQQKEEVTTQNNDTAETLSDSYIQSDKPKVITQADLDAISKDPTYRILEKKSPTASQISEWKNASQFGVWVDGKRIDNSSLKSNEAYSHYFISKLAKKKEKNYGSHYYQVDLMTPEYYEIHKKIQNPPSVEEVKAYLVQNEKVLNLIVIGSQIWLNGTETSVENFAKDLDALSKDWTSSEKRDYSIHVRTTDPAEKLWLKLQTAFETTDLYKANPKSLIPPPPPPVPAATDAGTPPPPPPPPAPVSPASFNEENYTLLNIKLSKTDAIEIEGQQTTISNVKKFIKKHFQYWTKDNPEKPRAVIFHLPEDVSEGQAHKAFKEIQDFKINSFTLKKEGNETEIPAPPPVPAAPNAGTPPPPPPAPSTQEMFDMAKDNIYYNDKKISPAKAQSLMKESDNYNILMTSFKGKKALIIKDKE